MKARWLAYLLAGAFGLITISFAQLKPCPGGRPCGSPPRVATPGTCDVDNVPRGSYQQTCRMTLDCRTQTTISGKCKTLDGAWKPATPSAVNTCTDIENCNGVLRCNTGGEPPQGSYRQSCRCVHVQTGTLTADCRRSNGSWTGTDGQGSQLKNFASCKNGIENNEGTLSCKR
jgi:hypothetical protein